MMPPASRVMDPTPAPQAAGPRQTHARFEFDTTRGHPISGRHAAAAV